MNNKSNLRFLLALGGTKVIITQEDKDLRVYSDRSKAPGQCRVLPITGGPYCGRNAAAMPSPPINRESQTGGAKML